MDGAALSRATRLPETVFTARRKLFDAKLRAVDPSVDSAFAALQDLESARRLNPRDADVGVLLTELRGRFLRFLGSDYRTLLGGPDPERTIRFASYAQEIQPTDHFLNQLLGAALLRVERFPDAIPYLERAATERPDNFAYLSNLAYAYERAQRYREAIETVRRLEALDPANPALPEARSRIEREMEER
jgi:tetratricopeptide (TPR) repeat protein